MADFKTHITTSTVLGVAYGGGAYVFTDTSLQTCMVAAGLCSVSGMLPDLDSDSGLPFREGFAFAAAVTPMLMLDKLREMGLDQEGLVLAAGLIYIVIRFGVSEIFKRYTVHRGMWHSIPAAATAGLLAFLIASGTNLDIRIYKAGGVVLGFVSHLILDELWSVDWHGRRLKKSAGTALKFFGNNIWANVSTYAKLGFVIFLVIEEPFILQKLRQGELQQRFRDVVAPLERDEPATRNAKRSTLSDEPRTSNVERPGTSVER